MLDYSKSENSAIDKHSSLLGAFVSYEETKVLWMPPPDFQVFLQLLTFLQSGKSTERIILKRGAQAEEDFLSKTTKYA